MQGNEEVLAVSIAEAARRLGVSDRTLATLIARKELPSRKVGRRRIIALAALKVFLENSQQIAKPPKPVRKSRAISRSVGD